MKLSAVVITYNEETRLARCLESLRFCDEIVVVDSESRDRTREIAAEFTSRIFTLPWRGYAEQKNEATRYATHDWILSIDADEEVSPELRQEIQALLSRPVSDAAYNMPRKTMHFGRWIKHGGWYPNRLVRLFRKSLGHWEGQDIHETWVTNGSIGRLQGDLVHHSFADLADQVERNNRYSSLGATRLSREGRHFSSVRLILKSFSKFFETYVWKRGFLDGYPGFIISVSAAYSVFLKWAKLWELEQSGKET